MTRLALLAFLLAAPALAAAAGLYQSDWSVSAKSRARLIADAAGAGLEIELAPGAITYWRSPGDAGLPPTFDFSGSVNLAQAEVDFPAPERIDEPDGTVAYGYRGGVVLPIRATPADLSKPVRLVAHVDYAVCEKLCLPAQASAEIAAPASGASPYASTLAKARADAPQRVEPAALGAEVSGQGGRAWRLCLAQSPRDLFVEAPPGFWIEARREADARCYGLTLQQAPDGAKPPLALRLTVEGADGARETSVTLS